MDHPNDPFVRPLPARALGQRARDWVVWFGLARFVVVSLSVMAVGAGGFWLLRTPPTPIESSLPRASDTTSLAVASATLPVDPSLTTATTSSTSTTTPAVDIVVHVAGHVALAGVYTLPAGARVVDAVNEAGGATASAQPDAINLAQPLRDGDRVYVPGVDDATGVPAGVTSSAAAAGATSAATAAEPSGPVDLNSATVEQFDGLPGVGPSTAAAIVAHRDQNGPFASVDDLDAVRGIGPSKLEALRDLVTV